MHGIGEDAYSAWTDPRTEVLWLRDLLPRDVNNIRVLSFEYTGSPQFFFGDDLNDSVYATAETLVANLHASRSGPGCEKRPLIFICHGLDALSNINWDLRDLPNKYETVFSGRRT